MRLALDAMGGDHAPAAAVEGAVLYARETAGEVLLVGQEQAIRAELRRHATAGLKLELCPAAEVVGMDEHPGAAMRAKRDSSLRVCFELVKRGEAAAMLSAGHSGAVLAGALFVLGRLPGVERPGFAAVLPTLRGRALLLDVGANTECKPLHLVQFALMGQAYARVLLGIASPRVGVVSNGEEDSKGTALTRKALERLRALGIAARYVEGKELLSGECEVLVTDGFTGNVALKTMEGVLLSMLALLRAEVESSRRAQAGYALMRPAFERFRRRVDYQEVGGACLVGVDGVAVVAHGRSNGYAIKQALKLAEEAAARDFRGALAEAVRPASPERGRPARPGAQ